MPFAVPCLSSAVTARRRWGRLGAASLLALALLGQAPARADAPPQAAPAPAPAPVAAAVAGDGSPVHSHTIVFIHGMFMTPAVWDAWQAYFRALGYTTLAPAWPLHDEPLEQQRQAGPELGALTLDQVIERYRKLVQQLPEKPIVIGHSMGGLVAQKLLEEGLAAEAVAIDSAPPSGLLVLRWSFLRSNWPVVNPFTSGKKPFSPTEADFDYAFANCLPADEAGALYAQYIVPESRLVGRGTSGAAAEVDFARLRGPLLLIAGGEDHIIPAALNEKNYRRYADNPSITDFKVFPGRCHTLTVDHQWRDVADYVRDWLGRH